jgi:hypothetical protein
MLTSDDYCSEVGGFFVRYVHVSNFRSILIYNLPFLATHVLDLVTINAAFKLNDCTTNNTKATETWCYGWSHDSASVSQLSLKTKKRRY